MAKQLFREASDIFMKRQADVQLGPFGIKHVTLYEPCNTKTFIWSLPAEILITTVALLGAQDLRSVTQISALSHFLKSVPHKSIKYITLFWNFDILTSLVLSQMVALLENIRASGVEELTCMGFCDGAVSPSITGLTQIQACIGANNLKAFEASSRAFFSPKILPFTIQTIHLSPCLEKLRLSSIKLSAAHWDKLMCHFTIPMLVELRVDADCAPPTLICFLVRHPAVSNLSVIP
ncbi:hypothetical protein BDR06DRAFT_1009779 [Suillus hirtellus]|nr:hypothetical protein BDR06DRAFT_1009779 [Suillus hirtellus]